jgi:hypothetical protein
MDIPAPFTWDHVLHGPSHPTAFSSPMNPVSHCQQVSVLFISSLFSVPAGVFCIEYISVIKGKFLAKSQWNFPRVPPTFLTSLPRCTTVFLLELNCPFPWGLLSCLLSQHTWVTQFLHYSQLSTTFGHQHTWGPPCTYLCQCNTCNSTWLLLLIRNQCCASKMLLRSVFNISCWVQKLEIWTPPHRVWGNLHNGATWFLIWNLWFQC